MNTPVIVPFAWPREAVNLTGMQRFLKLGFIPFCPFYKAKKRMAAEMKLRTVESQERWRNEEVREFAVGVSEIVRKHMRWPNRFFVPEDRCEVIFYGEGYALMDVFAIDAVLAHFGMGRKTFGEQEKFDHLNAQVYGEFIEKLMDARKLKGTV